MKKYVIVTDSCSDLEKELREKYDIDYIPMHITSGDEEYLADLDWGQISVKDFFDSMRAGKIYKTAQITEKQYTEAYEKYINDGYDILSISCSSALSASVKASQKVAEDLMAKYPDSKIVCIDSLSACYGLGLLCITASELRKEGKSIEETAAYIEENKLKMNQECTVEKLTYLKNAGRVSAASAFFGGLLSVKPIIISDAKGINNAVEKVKGRKAAIARVAERVAEEYIKGPYQKVYFEHADCIEDLEVLKDLVLSKIDTNGVEIHVGTLGPIIGASAGPGTVAVFFFGKEVTVK